MFALHLLTLITEHCSPGLVQRNLGEKTTPKHIDIDVYLPEFVLCMPLTHVFCCGGFILVSVGVWGFFLLGQC